MVTVLTKAACFSESQSCSRVTQEYVAKSATICLPLVSTLAFRLLEFTLRVLVARTCFCNDLHIIDSTWKKQLPR